MQQNYGDEAIKWNLTLASNVAKLSDGVGGKTGYRLGAVLINDKLPLKCGFNKHKTHPKLLPFFKYPFLHAEADVMIRTGFDHCRGGAVFVSRILKDGTWAMAKPCKACQGLIKYVGISECYFSITGNTYGALDGI